MTNYETSICLSLYLLYILSAAGLVSEGKMNYKKLKKTVSKLKGRRIIMSAHPTSKEQGVLNYTNLSKKEEQYTAFTSATNSGGTSILCFEKFVLKDDIEISSFDESIVRCGGTLSEIEFNPNESTIWILKLTVEDAFIREVK